MDRLLSCAGCLLLQQSKYVNFQRNRLFHVISVTLKKNHYEILGVTPQATAKEIRDAFVKCSKEVHPDKNPDDPENHNKFVRVHKAYSVLRQPSSRRQYDYILSNRTPIQDRMRSRSRSHKPRPNYPDFTSGNPEEYEQFWKQYNEPRGIRTYRSGANIHTVGFSLLLIFISGVYFYIVIVLSKRRRDVVEQANKEKQDQYQKQKVVIGHRIR